MNKVGILQEITRLNTIYSKLGTQTQYVHRIILIYTNKVLKILYSCIIKNIQNSEKLIEALTLFLAKNWKLTKGSMLCYTALPNHDITQLLCDVAEYVAKKSGTSAINVLMPDVSCDSLLPHIYPNLDNVDLREVITTHILGSSLTYLTPIVLLTKTPIEEFNSKLANPYFDFDSHDPTLQYLSCEDLRLLHNHSYETACILDAASQYKVLAENKDTLLGQLNQFVTLLAYNSAKGIGSEKSAGEGGYTAIVNFMKYWDLLDKEDIPFPLIEEINLIKDLGSDKTKVGDIASCFSKRREALLTIINGNKEKLASISLYGKAQEKQIGIVLNVFNEATANLEKHLNEKKYSGYEQRGITRKIIKRLNVNFECNNLIELTALLKGISAEEVRLLCDLKDNSQKIVRTISDVENIILLTTELSDEVFKSLLFGIKNYITDIIYSIADFQAVFITLNCDQCIIVIEVLKEQLFSIIKKPSDFVEILRYLTPEQKNVVFANLKEKLLSIIKDASSLKTIFQYLTPEQRSVVYEVVKDKIPKIINSIGDLRSILRCLTLEQCIVVCGLLKEKIPKLINSSDELREVLQCLTYEQCRVVCESVQQKLSVIIQNASDFSEMLPGLTPEQSMVVCESVKGKLPALIKSASDFKTIVEIITPEQTDVIYEYVKEKLPALIKSAEDFRTILQLLTSEQRCVTYESVKEKLPTLIKNTSDFKTILQFLTPAQCLVVCETVKEKLPTIIEDPFDVKIVFRYLNPEQLAVVCKVLNEKLPTIINNAYDFKLIIEYLNPEQRHVVCEILKTRLPVIINTGYDFDSIIEFLNPEQRSVVCETIKDELSKILEDIRLNRALALKKQRYFIIETNEANEALKNVQCKAEQLKKGFTSLFFKDSSQKKRATLDAISGLAINILRKRTKKFNFSELNELKQIIENDMPILKKHRGFIKFHKTTSNQIVINLLKSLEDYIEAHKMAARMGISTW